MLRLEQARGPSAVARTGKGAECRSVALPPFIDRIVRRSDARIGSFV